ncbi:MAG TPA: sugar phosphate isomerase/epimerase [Steroidobacteraceae bacterium]|jgi:sugar phosphate isomerase/epimerase
MKTDAVELIASYWTLSGGAVPHTDHEYSTFEFRERIEAIAKAGFKGVGLWHADLEHVLKTYSLRDMRKILDDNGMKYVEVEFLVDWFLEPGERRAASDKRRAFLLDVCEALGARHLKVGDFYKTPCLMSRLQEEFARLCQDVAKRGDAKVAFELMPNCVLESLAAARELVVGAAQPNGGIIFDLWHIVKLGIPYDEVMKFPKPHFVGLEINDGYLKTPAGMDIVTETTAHRKLCGTGEFDIKSFTAKLADSNYDGPVGIEVLSKELRSWPLERAATEAFRTTRAQFPVK